MYNYSNGTIKISYYQKEIIMDDNRLKSNNVYKYLTFWANGNIYAVPSTDVLQLIEMPFITPIPEMPDYIRGILHLRGENIPVIDLGLRLQEKSVEKSDSARIVVLSTKDGDLGLIVESIGEIFDLASADISTIPKIADSTGKHIISSVALHNGRLIPILDIATILSDESLKNIDLQQTNTSNDN